MGCRGGRATIRFTREILLKFSQNKIVMGKKIVVPCLDVIMIAVFYFLFQENVKKNCPEKRAQLLIEYIGSCSCPPGHPIILLNLINSIWPPYRSVLRSTVLFVLTFWCHSIHLQPEFKFSHGSSSHFIVVDPHCTVSLNSSFSPLSCTGMQMV